MPLPPDMLMEHNIDLYSFPVNAIRYYLPYVGISIKDLNYIGFYDKLWTKFEHFRREENPAYYDLINAFVNLTGCPVIHNVVPGKRACEEPPTVDI